MSNILLFGSVHVIEFGLKPAENNFIRKFKMTSRQLKHYFNFIFIFCLMGISISTHASPERKINEIRSPLFASPVFVKPGGSFEILFKIDGNKKPANASLVAVADSYSVVGTKLTEGSESQFGKTYKASVPISAKEALYDLRVVFSDGTTDTQPHSVKILNLFKKDFDFVHLTDIHFNDPILNAQDSNLARIKLLYEISKINPEFILFGGDLMLNPETYDRDYPTGYDILTKYVKTPIFMVPGNHEQYIDGRTKPRLDGRPYWESVYGPYYKSFTYDNLHFIGLNTFDFTDKWRDRFDQNLIMTGAAANGCIGPEQFQWLKNDLQTARDADETSLVFTHIPIIMLQGGKKLGFAPPELIKGPSPQDFSNLMEENKVPFVFVGHMHYNYDDNKLNPITTEIMTQASGTAGDQVGDDLLWGFRIVHVKNGVITGSEIKKVSHKSSQP